MAVVLHAVLSITASQSLSVCGHWAIVLCPRSPISHSGGWDNSQPWQCLPDHCHLYTPQHGDNMSRSLPLIPFHQPPLPGPLSFLPWLFIRSACNCRYLAFAFTLCCCRCSCYSVMNMISQDKLTVTFANQTLQDSKGPHELTENWMV